MKDEISRLKLVKEFDSAPDSMLFPQTTIAAVLDCSSALLERYRWAGGGIPFLKIGRTVRYQKRDVITWLSTHQSLLSTAQTKTIKGAI